MNRVFAVGCPRSGTTLLQSIVAAHPHVLSFPESHLFRHVYGSRGHRRKLLGIAAQGSRTRVREFLEKISLKRSVNHYLPCLPFASSYGRGFIRALDDAAHNAGCSAWLEKTPSHLLWIDAISALSPNATFIHIVRDGADTIASLFDATKRYPQQWGGERSIDACIERWIQSIATTRKYLGKSRHVVVSYEALTKNPTSHARMLADHIGVPFDTRMVTDRAAAAQSLVDKGEDWKHRNTEADVVKSSRSKQVFTEEELTYIQSSIAGITIDDMCTLERNARATT